MYQVAGFGRDIARGLWNDCRLTGEREIIFHCKSTLYLDILDNHSYNSFLPALYQGILHSWNQSVAGGNLVRDSTGGLVAKSAQQFRGTIPLPSLQEDHQP